MKELNYFNKPEADDVVHIIENQKIDCCLGVFVNNEGVAQHISYGSTGGKINPLINASVTVLSNLKGFDTKLATLAFVATLMKVIDDGETPQILKTKNMPDLKTKNMPDLMKEIENLFKGADE